MKKPIAAGFCEKCQTEFFIYDPDEVQVWMHPKPHPPETTVRCPSCERVLICRSSHRNVWEFMGLGVKINHSYDNESDIQPFTEEDVKEFVLNEELIISRLLEENHES